MLSEPLNIHRARLWAWGAMYVSGPAAAPAFGMNERQQEHYEISLVFGSEFSRAKFRNIYRQKYTRRESGSMIPSDYCIDLHPKGTEKYPKFLRWLGRGRYELVDGLRPS
jgi:hypothetical protein